MVKSAVVQIARPAPARRRSGLRLRMLGRTIANEYFYRGGSAARRGPTGADVASRRISPDEWHDYTLAISCARRAMSKLKRDAIMASRRHDRPDDDDLVEMIEKRRHLRAEVKKRIGAGLVLEPDISCGAFVDGVKLRGFRSSLDPILKLFVSKLCKGRYTRRGSRLPSISSSRDKASIFPCPSKALALDDEYVTFNPMMRGVFRVDLDRDFASTEECQEKIRELRLPAPNIITGVSTSGGKLRRPHVYFVVKHSVCFTGNGRNGAKALFKLIGTILTERLAPLGADRFATNTLRGKNPLCERLTTAVVYSEPYSLGFDPHGCESLADLLDLGQYRGKFSNFGAAEDMLLRDGRRGSNAVFRTVGRLCARLVHEFHPESPRRSARYRANLVGTDHALEDFEDAVLRGAQQYFEDCEQLRRQCAKSARYFFTRYDARIASANRRRGAMAAEPEYLAALSKREKQQAGGRYAALKCKEATLIRLAVAAEEIGHLAEDIGVSELARASGVSRMTIYRHRHELERGRYLLAEMRENGAAQGDHTIHAGPTSDCNIQCLDKRDTGESGSPEEMGTPGAEHPEGVTQSRRQFIERRGSRFMGSKSGKVRVHALNPVFILEIPGGSGAKRPRIVRIRDDVDELAYEAAVEPTIRFIDDFGRERMGNEPVIYAHNGAVAWKNPDFADRRNLNSANRRSS